MPLEDFLSSKAQLLAQTEGQSDAMGAVEREPFVVVASDLPCMVRPVSGSNARRNDRAELLISHRIYFDADAGFLASRRILVGSRVFTIVNPIDYNSLGRLVAVDCLEIVE